MKERPETVEAYIEGAPKEIRGMLIDLRRAIRAAAPHAYEKISYSIPYYGYKGRLAYFRYAKQHVGLYVMPPIVAQYKKELAGYQTAASAIRFPYTEKLPLVLIGKLIRARVKLNESLSKA